MLSTLINRAKIARGTECLSDEIRHLRKTLRQNGYNAAAFSRVMNKKHKRSKGGKKRETDCGILFTVAKVSFMLDLNPC